MNSPDHRARFQAIRDDVVTSLWFIPALMMIGAAVLAGFAVFVDLRLLGALAADEAPWWIYSGSTDEARNIVSTLLSSMTTMTTLVFSITMVVLTLAAQQFGPRLIRNFMASRKTQSVLGVFVMTILFCLFVLSSIGVRQGDGPLAFFTVTTAIVLMAASVVLLVAFVHSLAISIVSETVISRVGEELDQALEELAPLTAPPEDPRKALPHDFERNAFFFGPQQSGYVKAIEFDRLAALAAEWDVTIGFYFRAGDYLVSGGTGIAVYPAERFSSEMAQQIEQQVLIGSGRTPVQDIDFAIRHLVEIAVRALSPGVNDPYTAVAVVHRLSASLSQLMSRELPRGVYFDRSQTVRVVCPRPTYRSLLDAAFDQIRQAGLEKPFVAIHMIRAIGTIVERASLREQISVLEDQLRAVKEGVDRRVEEPSDREALHKRVAQCETLIDDRERAMTDQPALWNRRPRSAFDVD